MENYKFKILTGILTGVLLLSGCGDRPASGHDSNTVNPGNPGNPGNSGDDDGDGILNDEDPEPNNPCVPDINAPTCDQDNDGLINRDDPYPTDPDHDKDGVLDGQDPDMNNPCIPDMNAPTCDQDNDGLINKDDPCPTKIDCDDDGLTDFDELNKYGTNPTNPDTDDDGLKDGEEVNKYKTDPLKDDTDDDGLKDGEEVNKYKTDPLNPDTDGDELKDGDEIEKGTDPLNPDTDGDGVKDGEDYEDGTFTGMDPCRPTQEKGYRGYDNTNSIWTAADCDKDTYINGAEDNASLGDRHYLSDPYDPSSRCFLFNDLKYCEVDAKDNRTWLDRNLGAKEQCSSYDDRNCYGYLFQWGRSADGHQERNSATQDINPSIWPYESNKFEEAYKNDRDWLGEDEAAAYAKERQSYLKGTSDVALKAVCPKGWYVPSQDEFKTLIDSENIINASSAFASTLKLPVAGYKIPDNGTLAKVGEVGGVWSTDIAPLQDDKGNEFDASVILFYDGNSAKTAPDFRAKAYSIRCIKKQ